MFRRTANRRMIPYLHLFSPGGRASEKGMLYRNNNMNAFARVSQTQMAQRTPKEHTIYLTLMVPDQLFLALCALGGGIALMVISSRPYHFSQQLHKSRWFTGALNEHEFYQRNDEMGRIFAAHDEAIASIRDELVQPEVFAAPDQYRSPSGKFPLRHT